MNGVVYPCESTSEEIHVKIPRFSNVSNEFEEISNTKISSQSPFSPKAKSHNIFAPNSPSSHQSFSPNKSRNIRKIDQNKMIFSSEKLPVFSIAYLSENHLPVFENSDIFIENENEILKVKSKDIENWSEIEIFLKNSIENCEFSVLVNGKTIGNQVKLRPNNGISFIYIYIYLYLCTNLFIYFLFLS